MRRMSRLAVGRKSVVPASTWGSLILFKNDGLGSLKTNDFINYEAAGGAGRYVRDSIVVNGKITAVGYNGQNTDIWNSTDGGLTWTQAAANLGVAIDVRNIAYGNGMYVIVASNGTIYYSLDAINWNTGPSFGPVSYIYVRFGGGKFVAVHDYLIYTSTDGINWTYVTGTNPGAGRIGILSYAKGAWFGGGVSGGNRWRSADGVSWVINGSWPTSYSGNVIWTGTRYLTVKVDGGLYESKDGSAGNWLFIRNVADGIGIIHKKDDLIVIVGSTGVVTYSLDNGLTWTQRSAGSGLSISSSILT